MSDWQIYTFNLDGNGGITLADNDVRAKVDVSRELSGPGSLTLTIKPETADQFVPYKTLVVAERDQRILGTGIVAPLTDDGNGELTGQCISPLGYWGDIPFDSKYSAVNVDPARVVLMALQWAQGRPGQNLGVDFSSYKDTGVRIGNPDPPVDKPIYKPPKDPGVYKKAPEPKKPAIYYQVIKKKTGLKTEAARKAEDARYKAAQAAKKKARADYAAAMKKYRAAEAERKKAHSAAAKAFKDYVSDYNSKLKEYNNAVEDAKVKYNWWDNTTVGSILSDMAKHVDWTLTPKWAGDLPDHQLTVAKRIGARRDGLKFVVGENVVERPKVDWTGDTYATQVTFLGAGEGVDMIRATAGGTRNGLARPVMISDKAVRSTAAAKTRAERALKWRQEPKTITDLVVIDSDNAQRGTYDVGDEILVTDDSGRWAGEINMWVRILSITESTETTALSLSVVRADKGE